MCVRAGFAVRVRDSVHDSHTLFSLCGFFFKQKTAYEMRISDWSSDVCSSDLLSHLQSYDAQAERRMESPVWHIHNGEPPKPGTKLSFGMLLNLASVCNTEDPAELWGFITRYAPEATPQGDPFLNRLVGFALHYYQDFVKTAKR